MEKGTIIIALVFTLQGAAILWLAVSNFLLENRIAQTEIDIQFLLKAVDLLVNELKNESKIDESNNPLVENPLEYLIQDIGATAVSHLHQATKLISDCGACADEKDYAFWDKRVDLLLEINQSIINRLKNERK